MKNGKLIKVLLNRKINVTFSFKKRLFSNSISSIIINHLIKTKVMRKISLVLVAAMLLFTGNILANDVKDNDPTKSLSTQISEILDNNDFTDDVVDQTAQVRFTLNNHGEIVVMSVDTKNIKLESFVKARLNYKKVEVDNLEEGKLFTISVRIAS